MNGDEMVLYRLDRAERAIEGKAQGADVKELSEKFEKLAGRLDTLIWAVFALMSSIVVAAVVFAITSASQ